MSESKTPRTDAAPPVYDGFPSTVSRDFARQLETQLAARERELTEARDEWKRETTETALHESETELEKARSAIREAVELLERTRTCHFFVVPIRVTEVLAQLRSCLPAPVTINSAVPVDEAANCDKQKLTAIVRWLETNQPDVFRRGLWDAINKPASEPGEVGG